MKSFFTALMAIVLTTSVGAQVNNKTQVEQWGVFEWSYRITVAGNPFKEINLTATFSQGKNNVKVNGFYDGDGVFKIRFMPDLQGDWHFVTSSNHKMLAGKTGTFSVVPPGANNHGMVKVFNQFHFSYADSKNYYPFGTTCYAWTHQGDSLENLTLQTLAKAPFNKIRMCVFPKKYDFCNNEPEYYPFAQKAAQKAGPEVVKFVWDFERFDPAFFRHLENRVKQLDALGIEADLILFHPYDKGHWGFDEMSQETNLFYLKYVMARLAAYKNVWWSVANEFDLVKGKNLQQWDEFVETIAKNDPYKHLCSNHNSMEYFDAWKTGITHASIQNGSLVEDFGRAITLRDAYKKPIIYDEVCYEGDFPRRWGNLTGEEMVHRFWQGVIAGTYVTHGETYLDKNEIVWWAKGGVLHGSSPERIGFLRKILEKTGSLEIIDKWKDDQTSASKSKNDILIYFGKKIMKDWPFSLPAKTGVPDGTQYTATIIDTWNMTEVPVNAVFTTVKQEQYRLTSLENQVISMPQRAYMAIWLKKVIK